MKIRHVLAVAAFASASVVVGGCGFTQANGTPAAAAETAAETANATRIFRPLRMDVPEGQPTIAQPSVFNAGYGRLSLGHKSQRDGRRTGDSAVPSGLDP